MTVSLLVTLTREGQLCPTFSGRGEPGIFSHVSRGSRETLIVYGRTQDSEQEKERR